MRQEIIDQINKMWWWHCIDFGDGIVTKGMSNNQSQLSYLNIPEDLTGKSVLDIGAWDGYFSFEAEKRGASVTATDDIDHSWGAVADGKRGFDLAKKILNSKVKEYPSPVFELSPDKIGVYDIVFCFGVLYHVDNPFGLLKILASLTQEYAIIETASFLNDITHPILYFYNRYSSDPSNFFAPNIPCLIDMLLSAGFSSVVPTKPYDFIKEEQRVAVYAYK